MPESAAIGYFTVMLTRGSIRTFPATAETENTASYQGGVSLGGHGFEPRLTESESAIAEGRHRALREDQGERLTLTVAPTGYLWRETAKT